MRYFETSATASRTSRGWPLGLTSARITFSVSPILTRATISGRPGAGIRRCSTLLTWRNGTSLRQSHKSCSAASSVAVTAVEFFFVRLIRTAVVEQKEFHCGKSAHFGGEIRTRAAVSAKRARRGVHLADTHAWLTCP